MKKNKTVSVATVLLGSSLLLLSSCGGGGGGGGGGSSSKNPTGTTRTRENQEEGPEADLNGQYRAVLKTINQAAAGVVTGSVTLSREDDQLNAYVRFSGFQPNVLHTQHIHVAKSCPSTDSNNDGFIDAVEAFETVGKVLIPLDADVSSQDRGSSIWPVSDAVGYYHWAESTKYSKMMEDLREGDMDPEDDFVKLDADKNLDMSGRVVVIYGVSKETVLPETVQRRGRLANFQTLPIACGVFEKVREVPGVSDSDRDVGNAPVGESMGGSSGADDGATVIVGETSGGSSGGTGETTGGSTGWTTGGGSTGWTDGGSTGGETTGDTSGGSTAGGETSGGSDDGEDGEEDEDGGFMGGFIGGFIGGGGEAQ